MIVDTAMIITLALYNTSFINVNCKVWFNLAELLLVVEILVDRLWRKAVKLYSFLWARYLRSNVLIAGFKGLYLVLTKRLFITLFLYNSFNNLPHYYSR